jgi:hypothetical protein
MKKILCFLFLALSFHAMAQKSGLIYDAHAQKRSVGSFNAIKVSSAIDLYLTQSNVNEVAVSASEDDIRDQIVTEVVGGTLIIRLGDSGNWFSWKKWGNYQTKAYVSIKDINALSASGASNVHVVGTIESPKMRIKMTGASDLKNAHFNIGTLFSLHSTKSSKSVLLTKPVVHKNCPVLKANPGNMKSGFRSLLILFKS